VRRAEEEKVVIGSGDESSEGFVRRSGQRVGDVLRWTVWIEKVVRE
jgi:hypothetical protein